MLRQYDEGLLDTDPSNMEAMKMRRIFCTPFEILIKQQFLISDDEIELYGIRMSGSREADFIAGDTITSTYAYIANMVDLFESGIPFVINEPYKMRQIATYIDEYLQLGVDCLNDHHLTSEFLEDNEEYRRFYQDLLKMEAFSNSVKSSLKRFEQSPQIQTRVRFGQAVTRGFIMLKPSDREMRKKLEMEQRANANKPYSILQQLSPQNKQATRLFTPKGWR